MFALTKNILFNRVNSDGLKLCQIIFKFFKCVLLKIRANCVICILVNRWKWWTKRISAFQKINWLIPAVVQIHVYLLAVELKKKKHWLCTFYQLSSYVWNIFKKKSFEMILRIYTPQVTLRCFVNMFDWLFVCFTSNPSGTFFLHILNDFSCILILFKTNYPYPTHVWTGPENVNTQGISVIKLSCQWLVVWCKCSRVEIGSQCFHTIIAWPKFQNMNIIDTSRIIVFN